MCFISIKGVEKSGEKQETQWKTLGIQVREANNHIIIGVVQPRDKQKREKYKMIIKQHCMKSGEE